MGTQTQFLPMEKEAQNRTHQDVNCVFRPAGWDAGLTPAGSAPADRSMYRAAGELLPSHTVHQNYKAGTKLWALTAVRQFPDLGSKPWAQEQDTHRLLGVLHFSDTQVLQGDDPAGLFVLGQVQGERLYYRWRKHLFLLPRPILTPLSQA